MESFQLKSMELKTSKFRSEDMKAIPAGGWVNAIRTTLSMTLNQLAKRVNTNAARIRRIEQDELSGAVTLKTLRSVAAAMDSQLVYAIVPNKEIKDILIERYVDKHFNKAKQLAKHMKLEGQGVPEGLKPENFAVEDINTKGLWDD